MASKIFYTVVAVVGIGGASGAAWWYQNEPQAAQTLMAKFKGGAPAPAAAPSGPRAVGVEVAKVEVMTLRDDAQAVGSLRSRQNVMMRPEIAGRIMALGFTDGARVNAGQTLVQLDDTLQRAEVQQSLAQVSIAKANFVRNQELVAQNFVAKRVLDESAASLQVAEAQLSLSCARLDRMRIVAPFSGVVGIRNVNLGDYVKDGADLINLEDIGSLYVDFRLPERYQGKLTLQQSVELELDAFPNRIFRAKVEAIDPLIDANGRSIGVRALLPNTGGEPKPLPAGARPAGAPAAAAPNAAPNPQPNRQERLPNLQPLRRPQACPLCLPKRSRPVCPACALPMPGSGLPWLPKALQHWVPCAQACLRAPRLCSRSSRKPWPCLRKPSFPRADANLSFRSCPWAACPQQGPCHPTPSGSPSAPRSSSAFAARAVWKCSRV